MVCSKHTLSDTTVFRTYSSFELVVLFETWNPDSIVLGSEAVLSLSFLMKWNLMPMG